MINANIIADSQCGERRITTFELEYPRFIHSELMTHRMFSRNAASSRAIPARRVREQVLGAPAKPIHWGMNQPGMQAQNTLTPSRQSLAEFFWITARLPVCALHWAMEKAKVHKQVTNRMLEPWQLMKVVVTATEWDNWFHLRAHADAQPEIHELAIRMRDAFDNSVPREITNGEWHLPYVTDFDRREYTLEQQLKISASCCAQVSYRVLDGSITKAERIHDKLINSERMHASPFEHQAQALPGRAKLQKMTRVDQAALGVSHMDVRGRFWSGNFLGWGQYRKQLEHESCA